MSHLTHKSLGHMKLQGKLASPKWLEKEKEVTEGAQSEKKKKEELTEEGQSIRKKKKSVAEATEVQSDSPKVRKQLEAARREKEAVMKKQQDLKRKATEVLPQVVIPKGKRYKTTANIEQKVKEYKDKYGSA